MPIPLIIGIAAGIFGAMAVADGAAAAMSAHDDMKEAKRLSESNKSRAKTLNLQIEDMDRFAVKCLKIQQDDFSLFSKIYEKVQTSPDIGHIKNKIFKIDKIEIKKIKEASIGSRTLLNGLVGASAGTAMSILLGGTAQASIIAMTSGSLTSIISELGSIAACNAGSKLGSLAGSALGIGAGLGLGGVIFAFSSFYMSDRAFEALEAAQEGEKKLDEVDKFFPEIYSIKNRLDKVLNDVLPTYREYLSDLEQKVFIKNQSNINNWNKGEITKLEIISLMTILFFNLLKINLSKKSNSEVVEPNIEAYEQINKEIENYNEKLQNL